MYTRNLKVPIVAKVLKSNIGCYVKWMCLSILLYADDIISTSTSTTAPQQLLHVCEQELHWLDGSLSKPGPSKPGKP